MYISCKVACFKPTYQINVCMYACTVSALCYLVQHNLLPPTKGLFAVNLRVASAEDLSSVNCAVSVSPLPE